MCHIMCHVTWNRNVYVYELRHYEVLFNLVVTVRIGYNYKLILVVVSTVSPSLVTFKF